MNYPHIPIHREKISSLRRKFWRHGWFRMFTFKVLLVGLGVWHLRLNRNKWVTLAEKRSGLGQPSCSAVRHFRLQQQFETWITILEIHQFCFHICIMIIAVVVLLTLHTVHVNIRAALAAFFWSLPWPFLCLSSLAWAFCWDWIFCCPRAMVLMSKKD